MKAILLSVAFLALLVVGWEGWYLLGLRAEATRLQAANTAALRSAQKAEAEVRSLEEGRAAIGVVHSRLVDSTVVPEMTVVPGPMVPGAPKREPVAAFRLPPPLEVLQREGARWRFQPREVPAGDRSRAIRGEASAEFHRLLPLLAAMENLFPLVATDDLVLALPAGTVPFSAQATPLLVEASFRIPLRPGGALPEKR